MSSARTLRWVLAAPALLLGAFVYWTLALGLGAVSLSALQGLDIDVGMTPYSLELDEPSDLEETEPPIEAAGGGGVGAGDTIPVEVLSSREYQPGATAF